MLDFGLDVGHGRSKPYLIRDLAQFLVEERKAGRLALLIIDEAQNLSVPALEEVRMLSNFETEKSKLIQIVLVGQPNLRDLLGRHDLEQLRQRVTVSYHIEPLTADETHAYVNHRLRHASVAAPPLTFSRAVTDVIHAHSRGVARTINVIADAVLLYGYGSDKRVIDLELTHEVVSDLGLSERSASVAAAAQPTLAVELASLPVGEAVPDLALSGSTPAIDVFPAEGLEAAVPIRKVHADLPLQPSAAPVPSSPTSISHAASSRRVSAETPSPLQAPPQSRSWWSRLRRGISGQPRSAVEF
jgi:hypothetical protein